MSAQYEYMVDYYEAGVNIRGDGAQHGYIDIWPKPEYHGDVHPVQIYWDPSTKFFGHIQGTDPFTYTSFIVINNEEFFTSLLAVLSQPLPKHMSVVADTYPPIAVGAFTIQITDFALNTLSAAASPQSARARLQQLPEELRNRMANSGPFRQVGDI
jgi:hypothetical protein